MGGGHCGMARRFNPAPGWPDAPDGWLPPEGWTPDRSWPPAPPGWQLVIDDALGSIDRFRKQPAQVLTQQQLDEQAAGERVKRRAKEDARAGRRLQRIEARERREADPTRGLRAGILDQDPKHWLALDGTRDAERQNRQLTLTKALLDEQKETNRLLGEVLEELRRRE